MEFRAEQFSIEFEHEKKWYPAVTDLNMHIDAGEMVALIGESGCGKSITALSMMGLQPKDTRLGGHLCLDGESGSVDLTGLTQKVDEASRKRDFNDFSGADDGTQSTD